ncbi:MAG: 5'-3' exonuclease H3TH domain-containing protein [Candidatus Peribacteraceae bacterium]
MRPHTVIVDGHHLLYRAYWAIPRTMKTRAGEQVNTTFGMATMLLMILKTEAPDHILFCFDADEDTFRHEEYKEYKEGRAETPDDFYIQIPRALELIDTFGIRSISGQKMEADDFAATYATEIAKQGGRVTIVTGDRDLLQLASDDIRIAIPHKGYQAPEYMTPEAVKTKYGVAPTQIPSYKGLVGDSSDNLPGVHGIGPIAASKLIQEFGSIAGIFDNLEKVKPSWKEKLVASREKAFFSERMATLRTDAPILVPIEDLRLHIDAARVLTLFQQLEFSLPRRRLESLMMTPWGNRCIHGEASASLLTSAQKIEANPEVQMSLL